MSTAASLPQDLTSQACEPCHKDAAALTRSEAEIWLNALAGWKLDDDAQWLTKHYTFRNFAEALAFTNLVGTIAEREKHHPDILLGWGYVTLRLQTHALCGLHRNDFILASKIDRARSSSL